MSEKDGAPSIRRILVAIDTSHHSLAALEAAAELAARLEAHLEGVFVEDRRLLRVARHSAAREVKFPFASAGSLDPARMRRELRAQASEARRALLRIAEAREIEWSFRVIRGDVIASVLRASQHADLLSLGIASRPLDRRVRLGSTALAAALNGTTSVLVSQRGARITPPIVVVYDGSPIAQRALGIGLALAGEGHGYLSVSIISADAENAARLRREVALRVGKRAPFTRYRRLPNPKGKTLIASAQAETCGMLVMGANVTPAGDLQPLLDAVVCPVLLIR